MAGETFEFGQPAKGLEDLLRRDAQRCEPFIGKRLSAVTSEDGSGTAPDPAIKLWFEDGSVIVVFESTGHGWLAVKTVTDQPIDTGTQEPT